MDKWKANRTQKRGGGEVTLALLELEDCLACTDTPQLRLEQKELTAQINVFLKMLPDTEQKLFIRRYWYLDPVKTIAKEYGFSESKVKSMLSRTRSKLKTHLQKEGMIV